MAADAGRGVAAPASANPRWTLIKATILIASSLTVMSGAIIAPSLPALQAHFVATPGAELLSRLVLTVPAFFIAVSAPVMGWLCDRHGRTRVLTACAVAYAAAGAAGSVAGDLYILLATRAALGIAVAGTMTAATTLIGDLFEGEARARFMGVQGAFMSFGGVVFLSVGGLLSEIDWRLPFLIYLAGLLVVPPVLSVFPGQHGAPQARDGAAAGEPARVPVGFVSVIYGLALVHSVAFYMIPVQLPFYLAELGVGRPAFAGAGVAAASLTAAIASLNYRALRRRLGHRTIFSLALAVMAAGYAMVAASNGLSGVLAAMAVAGLGLGTMMPNMGVWLMMRTPAWIRGRIVGGMTTSIFLGQFLSPFFSEPMRRAYSLAGAYGAMSAVLAALAAAFAAWALAGVAKKL